MNLAPEEPAVRRRPVTRCAARTHFAYRAGAFSNVALHPGEQKYHALSPYVAVYFVVLSSTVIPQIGSLAILDLQFTRRACIRDSTRKSAQAGESESLPRNKLQRSRPSHEDTDAPLP